MTKVEPDYLGSIGLAVFSSGQPQAFLRKVKRANFGQHLLIGLYIIEFKNGQIKISS